VRKKPAKETTPERKGEVVPFIGLPGTPRSLLKPVVQKGKGGGGGKRGLGKEKKKTAQP